MGCRRGWAPPFQPPCPREREGRGRSEPAQGSGGGSGWCSRAGTPGAMGVMGAAAPCPHPGADQGSTSLCPARMHRQTPGSTRALGRPGLPICRDQSQPCRPGPHRHGHRSPASPRRRAAAPCAAQRVPARRPASPARPDAPALAACHPAGLGQCWPHGHPARLVAPGQARGHSQRPALPRRAGDLWDTKRGQAEHCLTLPKDAPGHHGPPCALSCRQAASHGAHHGACAAPWAARTAAAPGGGGDPQSSPAATSHSTSRHRARPWGHGPPHPPSTAVVVGGDTRPADAVGAAVHMGDGTWPGEGRRWAGCLACAAALQPGLQPQQRPQTHPAAAQQTPG